MANDSLLSRILKSIFFKSAERKAKSYAGNSSRLLELVANVARKIGSGGLRTNLSEVMVHLQLLTRMVKAYAKGEYRAVSWTSMASIVAVLIYFVSPIDVIPDFLPVLGLTDDVALVLWLVRNMSGELMKFNEWEKNEKTIKI
ncbi:YkvA family protein [Dyadobacter tibetensis]|uniref:YkvA family protein n=1 Tax=Dyadobacter tibetensis TaxID=1211851 RepID=UPI000470250B|nr:YkvA family protein [Dyadobacter tibetensis]